MPALTSRAEMTTGPTFEPVTVAELKAHLRIDSGNSDHDSLLTSLIAAAREAFERETDYVCCTSTWRERFDEWPADEHGEIVLAKRPVASITSIAYVDTNGSPQTWAGANYSLDSGRGMPAIVRAYDVSFPSLRGQRNAVTVTYVAGVSQASVPAQIKLAIRALASAWFEEPSAVAASTRANIVEVPLSFSRVCANYQRPTYP